MKNLMLFFAFIFLFKMGNGYASSLCDIPGSPATIHWDPMLCEVEVLVPATRCFLDPAAAGVFRTMCAPSTAGCEQIPGGCIGSLQPGHWTIVWVVENGEIVKRRCVCGCFAEETKFSLADGTVSGRELIDNKEQYEHGNFTLLTSTSFDGEAFTANQILQIVAGPEKEPVYTVRTKAGRKITLSSKHPVYIANKDGELVEVRKAEALEAGLLLSAIDGSIDVIDSIETGSYEGQMVNFSVSTQDNGAHFVFANELKMGDNAWQQYLSQRQARILSRSDILLSLMNDSK